MGPEPRAHISGYVPRYYGEERAGLLGFREHDPTASGTRTELQAFGTAKEKRIWFMHHRAWAWAWGWGWGWVMVKARYQPASIA